MLPEHLLVAVHATRILIDLDLVEICCLKRADLTEKVIDCLGQCQLLCTHLLHLGMLLGPLIFQSPDLPVECGVPLFQLPVLTLQPVKLRGESRTYGPRLLMMPVQICPISLTPHLNKQPQRQLFVHLQQQEIN